jgi:hypothetical protein
MTNLGAKDLRDWPVWLCAKGPYINQNLLFCMRTYINYRLLLYCSIKLGSIPFTICMRGSLWLVPIIYNASLSKPYCLSRPCARCCTCRYLSLNILLNPSAIFDLQSWHGIKRSNKKIWLILWTCGPINF